MEVDRLAIRDWVGMVVWTIASLLGAVPWVLLATYWLEAGLGRVGYSIGFIAAPALWTAMSLAAFWSRSVWGTAAWAIAGWMWWWGII